MIPFRDDVPARHYPVTTVALIVANIVAFLYQSGLSDGRLEAMILQYGVVPSDLVPGSGQPAAPLSLLTSMFLHGDWFHLLGNIWFLWIFGDNVEDRMGHFRFLAFYLLCGLAGSLAHVIAHPDSVVPTIGASGAIAGVLGAYVLSYPYARILTLIPLLLFWPIVELPAVVVLGAWFVIQLASAGAASVGGSEPGIAWWAHIGGFVTGMLLLNLFARRHHPR